MPASNYFFKRADFGRLRRGMGCLRRMGASLKDSL